MKWLNKLERKFGGIGVPNLMLYIVIGNLLVYVFDMLFVAQGSVPFSMYLSFSPELIMQGQVWRLLTFVFVPPATSVVWIIFTLYFYYFVGSSLESSWGTFRFTFYYLVGMIGTMVAGLFTGFGTATYLNLSLFFAFAALFPNNQVMLFFIIPIKVKYLGYLNGLLFLYSIITMPFSYKIAAVVAIANFLLFFGPTFIVKTKDSLHYRKKRNEFKQKMKENPWNHR